MRRSEEYFDKSTDRRRRDNSTSRKSDLEDSRNPTSEEMKPRKRKEARKGRSPSRSNELHGKRRIDCDRRPREISAESERISRQENRSNSRNNNRFIEDRRKTAASSPAQDDPLQPRNKWRDDRGSLFQVGTAHILSAGSEMGPASERRLLMEGMPSHCRESDIVKFVQLALFDATGHSPESTVHPVYSVHFVRKRTGKAILLLRTPTAVEILLRLTDLKLNDRVVKFSRLSKGGVQIGDSENRTVGSLEGDSKGIKCVPASDEDAIGVTKADHQNDGTLNSREVTLNDLCGSPISLEKLVSHHKGPLFPSTQTTSTLFYTLSLYHICASIPDEYILELLEQFGDIVPNRFLVMPDNLSHSHKQAHVQYLIKESAERASEALGVFVLGSSRLQSMVSEKPPEGVFGCVDTGESMMSTCTPENDTTSVLMGTDLNDVHIASMSARVNLNKTLRMQLLAGRDIGMKPGPVVQILNAVFLDDLIDSNEIESIESEFWAAASVHGEVREVRIPRCDMNTNSTSLNGIGKIFVYFKDTVSARRFRQENNGRRFDNRTMCVCFYPEERYSKGMYNLYSNVSNKPID